MGWEVYWNLVGGLPGYLPVLCGMNGAELKWWLEGLVTRVREAVIELGRGALERAYELLVEGREASDPDSLRVGRGLVSRNIAYPKGLKFKPQLNAYRLIISQWLVKGAPPSPADVLNAIKVEDRL